MWCFWINANPIHWRILSGIKPGNFSPGLVQKRCSYSSAHYMDRPLSIHFLTALPQWTVFCYGDSPMFPSTYIPQVLCSPKSHLPYVPRVLCSPVPIFPRNNWTHPMFPGSYVPRILCALGLMFPWVIYIIPCPLLGEHPWAIFFRFRKIATNY